jgi:hypothetical protein
MVANENFTDFLEQVFPQARLDQSWICLYQLFSYFGVDFLLGPRLDAIRFVASKLQ